VIGPPKSVSFDPAGKLTRAGEGFAQKYGIPIEKLSVVATPKGEYLAAQQVIPAEIRKRDSGGSSSAGRQRDSLA